MDPNEAIKQEDEAIVGWTNSSRRVGSGAHNEQQATNSRNMCTNTDKQYPLYGARQQGHKQLRPLKGLKLWEVIQDKVQEKALSPDTLKSIEMNENRHR